MRASDGKSDDNRKFSTIGVEKSLERASYGKPDNRKFPSIGVEELLERASDGKPNNQKISTPKNTVNPISTQVKDDFHGKPNNGKSTDSTIKPVEKTKPDSFDEPNNGVNIGLPGSCIPRSQTSSSSLVSEEKKASKILKSTKNDGNNEQQLETKETKKTGAKSLFMTLGIISLVFIVFVVLCVLLYLVYRHFHKRP